MARKNITTSTSHDGQHVLEFNEDSHRYKLDGKQIRGATTVNKGYPKAEQLIRWMVQQGIDEYVNKTQMKRGGDIGTLLHMFAECHEKGLPFDQMLITTSPYREAVERVINRFLDWRSVNEDEIVSAEEIIASVELQVGGKTDTLRKREGLGIILSDYKTAKNIYMEHILQVVGGYRRMYREWKNLIVPYVEIVTFPKEEADDMHVFLADKDGWTKDGIRTDIPDFFDRVEQQFERNVATYRFKQDVDDKLFVKKEKEEDGSTTAAV